MLSKDVVSLYLISMMWKTAMPALILLSIMSVVLCVDPSFDMPLVNVTVKEKETAILPCSVKGLGSHQVVWTDPSSTLLTFQDRRIIDDERLSVERPFTKDWNLHIRKVLHKDQGVYNCQVNTVPVSIKTINLIVQVPARIIDYLSTKDIVVREHEKVSLTCNATGIPEPDVTWYRHATPQKGERKHSEFCEDTDQVGVHGEMLIIHNVTRSCADTYECVAFNGVPPAVKRLIKVDVQFAPEIYLPNRRIGQDVGKETILECTVTAFPLAVTMWKRDGVKINTTSQKYRVEVYEEDRNKITLSLRIFSIERHDYGIYTCDASSPLGEDSKSMVLYEYSTYIKRTTISTSTESPRMTSTTHLIVLRPPFIDSSSKNPPGTRYPPLSGSGQHPDTVNTYRPMTYPNQWKHQQSEHGSQDKDAQPKRSEDINSGSSPLLYYSIWLIALNFGASKLFLL